MPLLQIAPSFALRIKTLCLRSGEARVRAESDAALRYAMEALSLPNSAPKRSSPDCLIPLVELTLLHLDNYADYPKAFAYALEWKQRAEEFAEQHDEKSWLGFALNVMGDIQHRVGNSPKALEYYHAALPMRLAAFDAIGIGWTLYNCSAAYKALGNTVLSSEYAEAAHEYAQQSGSHYGQAATLTMLASIQLSQHQYPQALERLRTAETLLREKAYTHRLPDVLTRLAAVLRNMGEYQQALTLVQEAENISAKGNLRAFLAASYRERALTLRAVKDFRAAEQLQEQALALEDMLQGASVQRQIATLEAEQISVHYPKNTSGLASQSPQSSSPSLKQSPLRASPFAILTPTEWRVARLLADNWKYNDIANELKNSPRTVETHRTHIIQKLTEFYGLQKASNHDITRFVQMFG